jgi:hypothetical protein
MNWEPSLGSDQGLEEAEQQRRLAAVEARVEDLADRLSRVASHRMLQLQSVTSLQAIEERVTRLEEALVALRKEPAP